MGSETTTTPPLTKRQRRLLGSHPSTTWQQQPRIKSASARAKAYITYAGLSSKNPIKKTIDPSLDLNSPQIKFGRLLGSTDQRKRHEAINSLQSYLRARSDFDGEGISELDLLKLWKGMWYTLYMCDKVPVQDRLSEVLAETMWCLAGGEEEDECAGREYLSVLEEEMVMGEEEEGSDDDDGYKLISVEGLDEEEGGELGDEEEEAMNEKHCRGAHLVSLYIATFLRTIRREWGNVDKHRVDKFYTSVRLMLRETYKYMAKRYWNMGIVRLFNDVLLEEALLQTPNGLRYHLIDICVEELAKVNKDASVPLTEATFLDCLEPFFGMAQGVDDKNVQKRVAEGVLLKFLNDYSFVSDVAINEEDDSAKDLVFKQVHVGTVAKFIFEIASHGDTDVRYRKGLYEMHKTFVRKIRAAGRDVDMNAEQEEEEAVCRVCPDSSMEGGESQAEEPAEEEVPAAALTKKEKKKKKRQKNHEQDIKTTVSTPEQKTEKSKVEETEALEPVLETPATNNPDPDESAPSTKSSKKKKRKKKQANDTSSSDVDTPVEKTDDDVNDKNHKGRESSGEKTNCKENEVNETGLSTPAKAVADSAPSTKPSKKKKRKKDEAQETDTVEKDPVNASNTASSGLPPLSKKKKNKQKSSPSVNPQPANDSYELAHEIDLSPPSSDAEGPKRVSFGVRNQSKSHKASMKALKTLTPKVWSTANRTPDKSILLKKPESEVKETKSKKKKGRS